MALVASPTGEAMRRLLLVPIAAGVLVACGSGSKPAHTTASTPSASPSASPSVSALRAYATKASPLLTSISTDLTQIKSAGDANDYGSMSEDCVTLKQDIAALRAIGDPPVAEAAGPFEAAMTSYSQAAVECAEGAQTPPDQALLGSMMDDLDAGTASLNEATRAVTAFGP